MRQATRHSIRYALGKQISEFGERLAVSPLDDLDATITAGFASIIQLLDAGSASAGTK